MKCLGIDSGNNSAVEISGGAILDSVEPLIRAPEGLEQVAPGFIDIQVNGFAGVDYNSARTPHEEIARSVHAQYACGVTRFFPTVITGGPDEMSGALRNLADAKESLAEGVAMEAFHVEGPHICPDDGPRGAHPRQWVRKPDVEEFHRWQDAARGHIRLVTLAPEWPEAASYIETLVRQGIVIAIGHTNATGEQIRDAVSAGATLSTHLGNGAHQQLLRHPNYIWEQLAEDRLAADFIVDGIHLPECYLRVALRAKGIERSILVTDASTPAGCEPGRYYLGEQAVDLSADGKVTLAGQTKLAGSALKMHIGVENLMKLGKLSLAEAITMSTRNPARVARIGSRQRGLTPGDRTDVVRFHFDKDTKSIEILNTWVGGELVYSA
jgi:N-acetylglucosamine-6-phosphate deacetylase